MKKLLSLVLVSLFVWTSFVWAEGKKEIAVGSVLDLSGNFSAWGARCQKAHQLALAELEADPSFRYALSFRYENNINCSVKDSLAATKKLLGEDVQFFAGFFTPEELGAVRTILNEANTFTLSYLDFQGTLPGFLYTWPHPVDEGKAIAERAIKIGKNAVVLGDSSVWVGMIDRSFKESFAALGGTVSYLAEPDGNSLDVRAFALKAKAKNPDVIVLPSYTLFPHYLKALSIFGNKRPPIFSVEIDDSAVRLAGKESEGILFVRPAQPQMEFVEKFQSRFNEAPDMPASYCYDQVKILAQLLTQAGSDPQAVRKAAASLKEFHGASGGFIFTPEKTVAPLAWFMISGGEIRAE